jgi:hypothetical protein
MRLSQGQLKLLATCPRKFQHIYLDQVALPTALDQLAKMKAGSQFHQLMQQHSLGLAVTPLLAGDVQLKGWFEAFQQQTDRILRLDDHEQILWQQSECLSTLQFQQHVLTVVYDWVMVGATQAQVLDWKTYPKPRRVEWLQADWQTRLYLYVLAETNPKLLPDRLSMTYWFFQTQVGDVQEKGDVQSLRIRYSSDAHEQTQQDLQQMMQQLSQWLDDYSRGVSLPQVAIEQGMCGDCPFGSRCGRVVQESVELNWGAIAEVPI